MATENPFPLSIGSKSDSWEKLQLLANIDPEYKYTADEWNVILQALNYLYENLGGGAGPDTDVTRIVKGFTTASSSFLDMVAGIDALSNYDVAEGEIVSFQTSIIDPDDVLNTAIVTLNTKDIGAGNYGVGGTSLLGKLWISGTRRLAYGDAEELPNTQIINLGTHTSTDVATEFNAVAEFTVQDKEDGLRLVNITIDAVELQYFFTGVGGDYGSGGDLTAVTGDFDLISGDVEGPDLSAYVQKSLFNANTILAANTDDTPAPITIAESQIVGRLPGGNIKGLSVAELNTLLGTKTEVISLVISAPDTDITVADTIIDFAAPYNFTLNNYWVNIKVAPTGSGAIVRLKKNASYADSVGTTINSGAYNSIANPPTITSSSFTKGDKIVPAITQIGSTIKGQYITLYLEILKN